MIVFLKASDFYSVIHFFGAKQDFADFLSSPLFARLLLNFQMNFSNRSFLCRQLAPGGRASLEA